MDYSMGQIRKGPGPTYSDKLPRNRPTDRSSPDRQDRGTGKQSHMGKRPWLSLSSCEAEGLRSYRAPSPYSLVHPHQQAGTLGRWCFWGWGMVGLEGEGRQSRLLEAPWEDGGLGSMETVAALGGFQPGTRHLGWGTAQQFP